MYYLVNRKQYVNIGYPLQILWSKSILNLYVQCTYIVRIDIYAYTPLFNKF